VNESSERKIPPKRAAASREASKSHQYSFIQCQKGPLLTPHAIHPHPHHHYYAVVVRLTVAWTTDAVALHVAITVRSLYKSKMDSSMCNIYNKMFTNLRF
jgi:hypothetical protein